MGHCTMIINSTKVPYSIDHHRGFPCSKMGYTLRCRYVSPNSLVSWRAFGAVESRPQWIACCVIYLREAPTENAHCCVTTTLSHSSTSLASMWHILSILRFILRSIWCVHNVCFTDSLGASFHKITLCLVMFTLAKSSCSRRTCSATADVVATVLN